MLCAALSSVMWAIDHGSCRSSPVLFTHTSDAVIFLHILDAVIFMDVYIHVCLSKALWNQSSDNECVLVTHLGVPLDRFKRIERLQPLRGDRSLASARFTVPIVRPVKRKRVLSSLHVRLRYPGRRLAHALPKKIAELADRQEVLHNTTA